MNAFKMPGFTAEAALAESSPRSTLSKVSRLHRAATGQHSATAAVQPALLPPRISCRCNRFNDPRLIDNCTCRWWVSPTCGGYRREYADGRVESDSWCD